MQQADATTTGGPPQHAPGGMLREYETIFLVRPDLAEDLVDKIVERMRGIVQRDGGKVIKVENWGKKKTAYEVKKHLRAIFLRFDYLGGAGAAARIAAARTWSGEAAASGAGRSAGTAPTRTSRSTTRTRPTSSTSSPSAARSSPGGSRATAPGTSARSPRRSSAAGRWRCFP